MTQKLPHILRWEEVWGIFTHTCLAKVFSSLYTKLNRYADTYPYDQFIKHKK